MSKSFFWYDLETFGKDSQIDRIVQFAGVRTDYNFNIIGEPVVLYCKITPDYLPDPMAVLITGITPKESLEKGICEYEFIKKINELFSVPETTVVGYNSIKFDDEFIRNALYRCFFDPYEREWKNNNSRWDILNLVRMTHDLRPDGIQWLYDESGKPSFRLEKLSVANGIEHENAHDALSDVYATIGIAKLIYEKQPKLFKYFFKMRKKGEVKTLLDCVSKKPIVFTSSFFSSPNGCTRVVVPLAIDPKKKNLVLCYDLTKDPTPLLDLPIDEVKRRIFSSNEVLEKDNIEKIPMIGIYLNRSPAVAPISVLDDETAKRLDIDKAECLKNLDKIKASKDLVQKIFTIYNTDNYGESQSKDPDLQIYDGFISDKDRKNSSIIHSIEPEDMLSINIDFEDKKLHEMYWRFVCRNYPEVLDEENRSRWNSFCAERILMPLKDRTVDFKFYKRKISERLSDKDISAGDKKLLLELKEYGEKINDTIFSYKGE